jgi:hypothetical protein
MSELDRIKEQLVYLRFWQGIMVVADIQFGGLARFCKWYRNSHTVVFRGRRRYRVELGHLPSPSQNRAPYRADRKVIAMDILVGIIMLAVALLFVGIALDAARRAK